MRRILIVSLIFFSLGISHAAFAADSDNGVIKGIVVNETVGGATVAGLEITLKTLRYEGETDSLVTRTDDHGQFTFENLATEPLYSYQISLIFQEASYDTEHILFADTEATQEISIAVFDSTTNDHFIYVAMEHIVVYVEQSSLLVKEYYLFVNQSDMTYIGSRVDEGTGTLEFYVPQEATDIQLSTGLVSNYVVDSKEGIADTMPLLPGNREIAFSYRIPYKGANYNLVNKVYYLTDGYNLLIEGNGAQVTSDDLDPGEPMQMGDVQFDYLFREELSPGTVITARFSDLPGSESGGVSNWLAWVLGLVVIGFVAIFVWRRKKAVSVVTASDIGKNGQALLTELAELDDAFENGSLAENEYRKLRSEKKNALVKLMHDEG